MTRITSQRRTRTAAIGAALITAVSTFALPVNAEQTASTDSREDQAPAVSLKEAIGGRFAIGAGTSFRVLDSPEDQALLLGQFGYLTPENCLKLTHVQPTEGDFHFDRADALIEFAERNGLGIAGHVLLWARDERMPEWFFKDGDQPASKELVLQRLRTHIHTVAGRYRGRIAMWDVVNEALADGQGGYLRDSDWTRMFDEEYLVRAFEYAREAAPDALLIYNDYRADQPDKREKLLRLVDSLQQQGAPLDAIGLQAHYELGMIPYEGIEAVLQAAREKGVKVVFSELDIDVVTRHRWYADDGKHREELRDYDPFAEGCPPEVLKAQADEYARLFALISEYSDVVARVTFWNLHDGQSWLNGFPWRRHNHPLLFDRARQPKPAFKAVIESLSGN